MSGVRSVRSRTTALAVVVVAVALGVGGIALALLQQRVLEQALDASLRQRVSDLGDAVERGDDLGPLVGSLSGDEIVVQIIDQQGRLLVATNDDGDRITGATAGNTVEVFTQEPADHDWQDGNGARIASVQARTPQDHVVSIVAAASTEDIQKSVAAVVRGLLIGTPLLLLVLAGVLWAVTGSALRPVHAIRVRAAGIGADQLDQRVPTTGTGDEIDRLAETMNGMLDRLQRASDQQRVFVADASHELRTPLTGIVAQLEAARMVGTAESLAAASEMTMREAQRMQRLIEDLLSLARADAGAGVLPPSASRLVDLDDIALAEARRTVGDKLIIDTSRVSPGQVRADPAALHRIVRNLLDNAARHAKLLISIELTETDDTVRLTIGDDGSGIAVADRERIFDRFVRLDAARTRGTGGSGLGLAIVRNLLGESGGTIAVGESRLGGASFIVEFPTAKFD